MTGLFRFIGTNGSQGYRHGEVYLIEVDVMTRQSGIYPEQEPTITWPNRCPYQSWEGFLKNWEPIK